MNRRTGLKLIAKSFSLFSLSLFACSNKQGKIVFSEAKNMKLESSAFVANELIPAKYTCQGQDISPPLSWDSPPIGTKSIALICDDPDAPGKTWAHWVVYNLPPDLVSLPENIPPTKILSSGGLQGINDFGRIGYGGPCPPSGTHRYFFKLYALDQVLDLQAGATKAQLESVMKNYILGYAELVGLYRKQ
jgi:Raf kinase inhibitor-like YbhB/YbcL family protein